MAKGGHIMNLYLVKIRHPLTGRILQQAEFIAASGDDAVNTAMYLYGDVYPKGSTFVPVLLREGMGWEIKR
jgi:hypothetical protein